NVQEGVTPLDREAAARLRTSGKPVLVAVNKVDTHRVEHEALEFAQLGFEKLLPVSAIHGEGIEALLDAATVFLSETDHQISLTSTSTHSGPLKLAIVGRPNVGKSSIINAITGSERVVVSPIPGTTRDAVDVPFVVEAEGRREAYVLIDTAGMRKTRRVDDS